MKKIKLTQGKYAIVDNEDFHYLSRFTWCYMDTPTGVYCSTQIGGKSIYMHEMILPSKMYHYLKHKNNKTLDNRKQNLELISSNHKRHLGLKKQLGASKYRGVQRASKNTWNVVIAKDKIRYYLGKFDIKDEKKAALLYNKKAIELYGDFAYQNKI